MNKKANLTQGILCYLLGSIISFICTGTILYFIIARAGYISTLALPTFSLPYMQAITVWIVWGILQAIILGKTFSLRQIPLFFMQVAVNVTATIWAIFFYSELLPIAIIFMLISSILACMLCFRLTSKKDARWIMLLPCALWLLYLLLYNYALILLN